MSTKNEFVRVTDLLFECKKYLLNGNQIKSLFLARALNPHAFTIYFHSEIIRKKNGEVHPQDFFDSTIILGADVPVYFQDRRRSIW